MLDYLNKDNCFLRFLVENHIKRALTSVKAIHSKATWTAKRLEFCWEKEQSNKVTVILTDLYKYVLLFFKQSILNVSFKYRWCKLNVMKWQPTLQVSAGVVWRENWSLCEGYAGFDPGRKQTCKCEIHLKGKQLIKLHDKSNIISLSLSKYSVHPHLFSFLCIHLLINKAVSTALHSTYV